MNFAQKEYRASVGEILRTQYYVKKCDVLSKLKGHDGISSLNEARREGTPEKYLSGEDGIFDYHTGARWKTGGLSRIEMRDGT